MSETFKPGRGPQTEDTRSDQGSVYKRGGRAGSSRSDVSTGGKGDMSAEVLLAIIVAGAIVYFASFRGGSNGEGSSGRPKSKKKKKKPAEPFNSIEEVQAAIRKEGLESCNLIVGIDFTRSNTWNGKHTFQGRSLHDISRLNGAENPYQRVMRIVASTLAAFDEDNVIPCYGFGDIYTQGQDCFPFFPDRGCNGLGEVLSRYNEIAGKIQMSGPTNFAPVINKAISIVKETGQYHVLVIIADGQVDKRKETIDAIVAAANHPLSILCVGIGDGPWDTMEEFDDGIPHRAYDNFQFVDFHEIERDAGGVNPEAMFARMALMELPAQYAQIRRLNLL